MTALTMLEAVAESGVKLLQFADNLPLHRLPRTEINALAARAHDLGMTLELGMTGCDMASVNTYLDLAASLNVNLLRIAPTSEESTRDNAEVAVLLKNAALACETAGVTLAVENHFHLPSPRLLDIIRRVDEPSIGICLDVANSIACGEWPSETIALLAPLAVNLHLKDYRLDLDPDGIGCRIVGTPLGEGVLDIGAVFEALDRNGRHVNVILEHWLPWQENASASQAAERFWIGRSIAAARRIPATY